MAECEEGKQPFAASVFEHVSNAYTDRLTLALQSRKTFVVNGLSLTQKIIAVNLVTVVMMILSFLYFSPFRDYVAMQFEETLQIEAALLAQLVAASIPHENFTLGVMTPEDMIALTTVISLPKAKSVYVYANGGALLASSVDLTRALAEHANEPRQDRELAITASGQKTLNQTGSKFLVADASINTRRADGVDQTIGAVVLVAAKSDINAFAWAERAWIGQVSIVAILMSIGLSFVLASTIATPLAEMAAAASVVREEGRRKAVASRVLMPDLSGRSDEIGHLSYALRDMVSALYDQLGANEQFAADVSHEIKNPLASLRSAIEALSVVEQESQREELLAILKHDVLRMDRLISDIANASRLSGELVKEDNVEFNLLQMMSNLTEAFRREASKEGVDFISDLPKSHIDMCGIEARLAQVFVNLVTNAISFCEEGDAVRLWVREKQGRVLIVVEDTGPGIPEEGLSQVFNRFYSERPEKQFGNNSGLGLAISKQIVEAHGGVIWAENIRPTDADVTSDPLGTRFVVGLPI